MVNVPRELVAYVCRLLAAHRRSLGTRKGTRALTPWRQALFGLIWYRKREDLTVLGAGFGISRATAYRYPTRSPWSCRLPPPTCSRR